MANFERKLLKFWIQSFLLGVPRIILGFRTQDGKLCRLEDIMTQSIPAMTKRPGSAARWDGNVCINFAGALLECEFFLFFCLFPLFISVVRQEWGREKWMA